MAATNRRQLLTGAAAYAAGAAIVAGGAALASEAKGATISPDLSKLIAAVHAKSQAAEAYERQVYEPARARAAMLIEAIPHASVSIDDGDYWTTARPGAIRVARRFVENDPERRHPDSKQLRNLVAAAQRREREAERIRKATGLSAAVEQSNANTDAIAVAEWAVASFACRSASDLSAKVSFMSDRQMDDGIQVLEYILPDVLRLAAAEGR